MQHSTPCRVKARSFAGESLPAIAVASPSCSEAQQPRGNVMAQPTRSPERATGLGMFIARGNVYGAIAGRATTSKWAIAWPPPRWRDVRATRCVVSGARYKAGARGRRRVLPGSPAMLGGELSSN